PSCAPTPPWTAHAPTSAAGRRTPAPNSSPSPTSPPEPPSPASATTSLLELVSSPLGGRALGALPSAGTARDRCIAPARLEARCAIRFLASLETCLRTRSQALGSVRGRCGG